MILQAPVKMHFRLLAFITMSITLLIVNVAYNNTVNHNSSGGVLVIPKSSLQRSHPNNCCVKKSTSDNCTAPPAVSTCPSDRFFLFLPYGNFNNALRMLVLSLIIGQWTHRSVLLVDGMFRFNWRQSIEYSFDNLCVHFANESQLLRRLPIRKPPLRMLYWDDTAAASVPATLFGWWSVDRVHLDGQLFNRLSGDLDNIPRLACVASRLPEFNELDDDAVIAIPNPFFLGLSKSEYMRVFAGIRIHSTARTIGQQFIQSQFNNQQFVGIHLRWFEGVCEQFSRQTIP
jgi:hypothetical protein